MVWNSILVQEKKKTKEGKRERKRDKMQSREVKGKRNRRGTTNS